MGGGGGSGEIEPASSSSSKGELSPVGSPQRGQKGGSGVRESSISWLQFVQVNMMNADARAAEMGRRREHNTAVPFPEFCGRFVGLERS